MVVLGSLNFLSVRVELVGGPRNRPLGSKIMVLVASVQLGAAET